MVMVVGRVEPASSASSSLCERDCSVHGARENALAFGRGPRVARILLVHFWQRFGLPIPGFTHCLS